MLQKALGDAQTVRERLRGQVTRRYSWGDLTEQQTKNLTEAIEMANLGGLKVKLAQIDVVDFRDAKIFGQYKDERLLLAAKTVADWRECLATLIHEAAHAQGGDGEHGHVAAIENAWAKLVEALWR